MVRHKRIEILATKSSVHSDQNVSGFDYVTLNKLNVYIYVSVVCLTSVVKQQISKPAVSNLMSVCTNNYVGISYLNIVIYSLRKRVAERSRSRVLPEVLTLRLRLVNCNEIIRAAQMRTHTKNICLKHINYLYRYYYYYYR